MGVGPRWKATGMGFKAVLAQWMGPAGPRAVQRSAVVCRRGWRGRPRRAREAPISVGAASPGRSGRDEEDVMGALDGKIAIVTGGASGIGLASGRRLTAEGATVVVVDANGEGAEKAAAELGGVAVQGDVGDVGDWARFVDAARGLGGIDIAYLNAGVTTGEEDITKV